jgi:hypothetical protein
MLNFNIDVKSIFILYLIVGANFLAPTFTCGFHSNINRSPFLKHIIGFFTMLFFITLTNTEKSTDKYLYFKKVGMTFVLYTMFILSTRAEDSLFIFFMLLLTANFVLNSYADSLDPELYEKEIKKYKKYSKYITQLTVIVLVFAVIMYFGKKKIESSPDTKDLNAFLFKNPSCKFQPNKKKYSYGELLKSAFKDVFPKDN